MLPSVTVGGHFHFDTIPKRAKRFRQFTKEKVFSVSPCLCGEMNAL
jgi:hypothetical protein